MASKYANNILKTTTPQEKWKGQVPIQDTIRRYPKTKN